MSLRINAGVLCRRWQPARRVITGFAIEKSDQGALLRSVANQAAGTEARREDLSASDRVLGQRGASADR